jgi:hypothetical protein
MTEINWDNVTIVWHDEMPAIDNIEHIVLEDCKKSLWGLGRVSDLVFHLVFLSKNHDSNVVNVWGEEDNEDLHCEYVAEVDWSGEDDVE